MSGIHPAPLLTALSGLGGGKLNSLGKSSVYIRFKQVLMSDVSWEHDFLIYCRLQQKHTDYRGKLGRSSQHSGCFCEVGGYHILIFLVKGFYHHHHQPSCFCHFIKVNINQRKCNGPGFVVWLQVGAFSEFKGNFSVTWVDFLRGDWRNDAEGGGDPELPRVCALSNFRF